MGSSNSSCCSSVLIGRMAPWFVLGEVHGCLSRMTGSVKTFKASLIEPNTARKTTLFLPIFDASSSLSSITILLLECLLTAG